MAHFTNALIKKIQQKKYAKFSSSHKHIPFEHQETLIRNSIDVGKVFEGGRLLALSLVQAAVQEVFVVGDRVVTVLVQGTQ